MLRTRVIPCLLLQDTALVKGKNFRQHKYIGDPVNTLRIFNELEVDELCILDIGAQGRGPNVDILTDIVSECFMPLSYGGGISSVEQAGRLFSMGFEKIVVNSAALERPQLVSELADRFGSQAVVVSIDVKKSLWGAPAVFGAGGRRKYNLDPIEWAKKVEALGAGELLLTSIDREGTWHGFDCDLVRQVSTSVSIPVIAHGGASSVESMRQVVKDAGADAVAVGSMVVYQKQGMGVLINFPNRSLLEKVLS